MLECSVKNLAKADFECKFTGIHLSSRALNFIESISFTFPSLSAFDKGDLNDPSSK